MIYNVLAKYYDGLVKDEEATSSWVNLIHTNMKGKTILELACGSGEITIALAKLGYSIEATDLSEAMIVEAKKKEGAELISFFTMDMCNFTTSKKYDGILCLCDSINYLTRDKDVEKLIEEVNNHLNDNGTFIFDMHSLDRLYEFEDEFYEEGIVENHEYVWSIVSEEDCIYHNFMFYDEEANCFSEQHIQRVYTPEFIESLLSEYFDFEVYTDFNKTGIMEGEKYFYVCHKK